MLVRATLTDRRFDQIHEFRFGRVASHGSLAPLAKITIAFYYYCRCCCLVVLPVNGTYLKGREDEVLQESPAGSRHIKPRVVPLLGQLQNAQGTCSVGELGAKRGFESIGSDANES